MQTRIEYIHHSCYTVEIGDYFLVFDYFKGNLQVPNDKKVYFFASHAHPDHFNEKIFAYAGQGKKYILSDDIKHAGGNDIVFIGPDETVQVDGIQIKTLLSTDEGVAFLLKICGKTIYFAGDLNDWYWEMEDSQEQREDMHARFVKEMDKLKGQEIDLMFFLVDPRQQGQYDLGGKQALELNPKHFLPMHFWRKYDITRKFKEVYSPLFPSTKIHAVEKENQVFFLEI